jgi:hypothetical protein
MWLQVSKSLKCLILMKKYFIGSRMLWKINVKKWNESYSDAWDLNEKNLYQEF